MKRRIGFAIAAALAVPCATAQTTTRVSVATGGAEGNDFSTNPFISADGRFVAFESAASNLVPGDTNGDYDIFSHDRQTGETSRVSVATGGAQANDWSLHPCISADGRFVAFSSRASNLVPSDSNGTWDIFVHDGQTGETSRVSVATGGAHGNGVSRLPSISADGRFVAFESDASNLVPGDTNGDRDIFVHDRQVGQTTRVGVATDGAQGNDENRFPSISADGRFVAFGSWASNLVPGDTNGDFDVFVHDRQTAETSRVSVAAGGAQANDWSLHPSISADGRFVAFESAASNLVPGDTNGDFDVFVHDRQTGETRRVSIATGGQQGNFESRAPSISADGRFAAFWSSASNLVTGDTNNRFDVFVHDRQTGQTIRVSVATGGAQVDDDAWEPSISADGRFVAFESGMVLVPGDRGGRNNVFVHDRCASFPCPGDADGDGEVTFADITSVLENWGLDFVPCTGPGDANHDGTVIFADITRVLENWGMTCR